MILKIIKALSKQSKLIDAKLFPRARLLSRVWSSLFSDRVVHLPWAIKAFLVILIFSLMVGCSQKSGIARENITTACGLRGATSLLVYVFINRCGDNTIATRDFMVTSP